MKELGVFLEGEGEGEGERERQKAQSCGGCRAALIN